MAILNKTDLLASFPSCGDGCISASDLRNFVESSRFIQSGDVNEVPLTVQGTEGQTANLQEWIDSNGTTLGWVTPAGLVAGQTLYSYGDIYSADGTIHTSGHIEAGDYVKGDYGFRTNYGTGIGANGNQVVNVYGGHHITVSGGIIIGYS